MENKITVVLADANEEFRTALKQTLDAAGEFEVVGSASDGPTAYSLLAECKPQLLVMDPCQSSSPLAANVAAIRQTV